MARILIIDDDEVVCYGVKSILGKEGYEVMALPNAKDIIAQVNKFKPDIILLDLSMPFIGGIEVCEMLNEDPNLQGIPIIILSALDKQPDKLKAYKQGVVEYLVKPIDREVLVAKIAKFLKYKREA
jgi:twitching motility two-component system response regulator PilH